MYSDFQIILEVLSTLLARPNQSMFFNFNVEPTCFVFVVKCVLKIKPEIRKKKKIRTRKNIKFKLFLVLVADLRY